jgi:Spy/CpxP family protein refolding chaperone
MNARIRNKWKTGLLLGAATLVLVFAASALAQTQQGGFGKGRGRFGQPGQRLEFLTERLDLTEDQVAAIETIHQEGRQQAAELRKDMMRLRNELEGEMLKDEPSDKAVLDLTQKIGNLRTELDANRVSQRLQVRKQLTPEQRDLMLMMGQGQRGGRGGRGGHGFRAGCDQECDGSGPAHGRGRRGGRVH